MPNIVVKPNLLRTSTTRFFSSKSGDKTITELVDSVIEPSCLRYVKVLLNGHPVDPELWDMMRPKDVNLQIAVVTRGGDDGKNVVRLVAVIALTIASSGAGAAAGGGFVGGVTTASIVVAGTFAIHALFPPPALDLNTGADNPEESPTLTIGGQRNRTEPGATVIRIYGKHKIAPPNAAFPYIQTKGKRTQTLFMLFDLGYGDISVQDIRIGDSPIGQLKEVELIQHNLIDSGEDFKLYTKDVQTTDLALVLEKDEPVSRTTGENCNTAQIDLTFPQGCVYYDSNGSRQRRDVNFKVEYRKVGNSAWQAFGNTFYSFSREDTGVKADLSDDAYGHHWGNGRFTGLIPDGTRSATRVNVLGKLYSILNDYDRSNVIGTPPELYGYPKGTVVIDVDSDFATPIGSLFQLNGEVYKVMNDTSAGLVSLIISPPLKFDLITNADQYTRIDGDVGYKPTGFDYYGWITHNPVLYMQVSDATNEPFTLQMDMRFTEKAQYEIQVTRMTVVNYDGGNQRYIDTSTWSSLRTITNISPVNFHTPHTMIELKVTATDQLQGTIDNFTCIATSILPVYNGVMWKDQETSNPAWIAYDIMTGTANPYPIDPVDIDLDKFLEWAKWCDTTAANADEPRFRCDVVIDFTGTVFELLKQVMSTGRASPTVRDGKYSLIYDKEKVLPVQLITPHNSWAFSGERLFGEEPEAIKVKFVDPDAGWERRELVVYNTGFDESNATKFQELPLFGCTRNTQAWRDGRYFLAQAILRQESFNVTMDIENIICERGDFVQLQNDVPRIGGKPARVSKIVGDIITATEPFEVLLHLNDYYVTTRSGNNTIKSYQITEVIDEFSVRINLAPGDAVIKGDLIVHGVMDFVIDDYLVKEIRPGEDLSATVFLQPLARDIYSIDTEDLPSYSAKISPETQVNAPLVINLSVLETLQFINRFPYIDLALKWEDDDTGLSEVYEIYEFRENKWELLDIVRDKVYFVYRELGTLTNAGYDVIGKEHKFKVIAVTSAGNKFDLDKATEVKYTPVGDIYPPPTPSNFAIDVVDKTIHLFWSCSGCEDGDGFIIRYTPELINPAWEKSTTLGTVAYNVNSTKVNARVGTYMVKAVDTSGNFSEVAAVAKTQIPSLTDLNVVLTINEHDLGWLGLYENMQKFGTTIETVEVAPDPNFPSVGKQYATEGIYTIDGLVDLSLIYECRISVEIEGYGIRNEEFMADWDDLASVVALQDDVVADWDAFIEVRTGNEGTFINEWTTLASVDPIANPFSTNFTDWKRVNVADITGRFFDFRIRTITSDPTIKVVISTAKIIIDMPDRVATDRNITITAGGEIVTYDVPFYDRPALAVTVMNGIAGYTAKLSNESKNGFTVEIFDKDGVTRTGAITWQANGYGRITPTNLPPN
jgi:hypothetical protein